MSAIPPKPTANSHFKFFSQQYGELGQEFVRLGDSMFGVFTRPLEIIETIKTLFSKHARPLEEIRRAPFKLISAVSDSIYSTLYITDTILIIGHLFGHLKEPPPFLSAISRCLMPLALAISIIDSGLNVDKLIRSFTFHSNLKEQDIAEYNELLQLLSAKKPNQKRLDTLLQKHKPIKPSYTSISRKEPDEIKEAAIGALNPETKTSSFHRAEKLSLAVVHQAIEKLQESTDLELSLRTRASIWVKKEKAITTALRHIKDTKFSTETGPRSLGLRVENWCAKETGKFIERIQNKIDTENLSSQELNEAEKLLEIIKIQGQKTRIINALALTALVIMIVGCVASMLACPFLIPLVLFLVGGTLAFSNWVFSSASLPCEGWQTDFKKCFPPWLENLIFKTPEPKQAEALSPDHQVIAKGLLEIIASNQEHLFPEEWDRIKMIITIDKVKEITEPLQQGPIQDNISSL